MRRFTLFLSAIILGTIAQAQTVATFDDLTLPTSDTFYINLSASGSDVGFADGNAFFPCLYDTTGGFTSWNYFAYSNKTDSVTSDYSNEYSAKTGIGYGGSANYAIAFVEDYITYAPVMNMKLTGAAIGHAVNGFYVTNSTCAYNNMRDGDTFSKIFGGTTGNDPDWFLLTIKGYRSGALTPDSVNFYLADYRFADNDSDYIVKTWDWVNLLPLGHVDSLQFSLSSTDNGSFGMNTPAYFCMDNFTTNETDAGVSNAPQASIAKIYPVPATDILHVDINDGSVQQVIVTDMSGKAIGSYAVSGAQVKINISSLPSGVYMLQLIGNGKTATAKFTKR